MVNLTGLGWDEGFRAAYASMYARRDRPDHRPARVSGVDRGVPTVLGDTGPYRTSLGGGLLSVAARHPVRLPGPGDWVVVRTWPDHRTTIEAVLPRRTTIIRAPNRAGARPAVVAANVDAVAVVVTARPVPDPRHVGALVRLARDCGVRPLVVVTAAGVDVAGAGVLDADLLDATAGGDGLARLRSYVAPGRTVALLCPPGSDTSMLVNVLVGATVITTTGRRGLVPVPGGGAILDTPGLRTG